MVFLFDFLAAAPGWLFVVYQREFFVNQNKTSREGVFLDQVEVPEYYLIVWDTMGVVRQLYDNFSKLLICLKC